MMALKRTRLLSMSLLALSSLALASCGDSSGENSTSSTATDSAAAASTASSAPAAANATVTFEEGVIRASTEENPMTALFGELHNSTGEEVTITGFIADIEAGSYEIHETINGTMQQKEGGITLSAGEDHDLEPGGDHFMIMELTAPLAAGDVVALTLDLSDGSTVDLGEVPVRTMAAGDEDYGNIHDQGGHGMHDEVDGGMRHEH